MMNRLGYVIALALSNALRDYAERSAVRRGESEVEASLKGLQAAFWTLTAFSLTCEWARIASELTSSGIGHHMRYEGLGLSRRGEERARTAERCRSDRED